MVLDTARARRPNGPRDPQTLGGLMTLHHSEETHANLLARLPTATGRGVKEWFQVVEEGPSFTRFDERVHWLQDEHGMPHGYATAIVHEYDKKRAARRTS
jgi:hypothetical protein